MSFLVSFNGQFSPYVYPAADAWHAKVTPVNKLEATNTQDIPAKENEFSETYHPPKVQINAYLKQIKTFEQEKSYVYAKDIMSSPVHFVKKSTLVSEAISLMKKFGFRHLPVLDGKEILVGVLSDRELIGAMASATCESIMIPKVLVALQSARIQEIAHIMLQEKINTLPIIDDNHQVVGIITQSDILMFVIKSDNFSRLG